MGIEIVLPEGGYTLVMIEAYFDESGTHGSALVTCSGGYLFESEKCRTFDAAWRQMLSDFQIPFFHMASVECGGPPMDKLPSELRQALLRRAISIIKETATYCVVVAVPPRYYEKIMPDNPLIGSAFNFVTHQTLMATARWADQAHYDGSVHYFFESGHPDEENADAFMHLAVQDEELVKLWRYGGHTFMPKMKLPALQAADLLVWHYYDNWTRVNRGEYTRASYKNLIESGERGWGYHWTRRE
jgi:hypothetical protein